MSIEMTISPLNEVCSEIIDCVNKTAPVVDFITPYKMIRTTNVKKGFVDVKTVRYVTKEVYEKWTRRTKPRRNDVILTREAPLGEIGLLRSDDNIFLGQRLIQYRANKEILDQLYLYYAFQDGFMQSQILSYGSGSTVEHLRIGDCETIKIKYPNLPTQQKIANILSAYDELIENNNKRIQLLEEMAEELYKEWFIRMRFPDYQNTSFYDKEGKEVPHGTKEALPREWEEKRFEEIITLISGYAFKSSDFSKIPQDCIAVRMGNFNIKGGLQFQKNVRYLESSLKLKPKYKLEKGDLLMVLSDVTRDGSIIGNVGFVPESSKEFYLNQRVSKLVYEKKIKYYLYQYLNSQTFKNYCLAHADSATVLNLSNRDIYKHKLVLPSNDLIIAFENIIKPILAEIELLISKNQLLQETRDLLLPRLISGKLSVAHIQTQENTMIPT